MTLVRWTPKRHTAPWPIRNLHADIDRFFDDFFALTPVSFQHTGHPAHDGDGMFLPRVDVRDLGETYQVIAHVPGFTKEQLSVEVHGDRLTLGGTVDKDDEASEEHYYRRESHSGSFCREIDLPGEVLAEGHEAHLNNGVLTVTLKKVTDDSPKTVQVPIS